MEILVVCIVLALAFANGANDNFKGVATLYGSRTATYRTALSWATVTTAAGGLLAPFIAAGLIKVFKAKGLVPDAIAASPDFIAAAALAAAATVAIATRVGLPVSTTHALTGGLAGAGAAASWQQLNLAVLGKSFLMPLIAGPFVGITIAFCASFVLRRVVAGLGISSQSCVCVGEQWVPVVSPQGEAAMSMRLVSLVGEAPACVKRYDGVVLGIAAQSIVDRLHFLSAGAVSFARGINDTPKILALALATGLLANSTLLFVSLVAGAMAVGGLVGSRRIAETTAHKVSSIESGPGLVANMTAAGLVIVGSLYKLPLSTTHVTMGGIVGAGLGRKSVDWRVFSTIVLAWVTTLPIGVVMGTILYQVLSRLG